jgi:DNA-binding MarR family transcriptional regulator
VSSSSSSNPILAGESRDAHPNIGILLRAPFHAVVDSVTDGLARAGFHDVRPAHSAVFQHIKAEGSRLSELAGRARITNQSMGYLVDNLERMGYVERVPDPTDRRAVLICLTERGWEQVRASLRVIADIEAGWARALGKRKVTELRKLLEELGAVLEGTARMELDGERGSAGTSRDRIPRGR